MVNPPIRVEWSDDAGRRLVWVAGEIDIATVDELRKAFDCSHSELEVDMSNVVFIDLSGLRCLVQAAVEHETVELIPSPCVTRLLELTRATHLFEIR